MLNLILLRGQNLQRDMLGGLRAQHSDDPIRIDSSKVVSPPDLDSPQIRTRNLEIPWQTDGNAPSWHSEEIREYSRQMLYKP